MVIIGLKDLGTADKVENDDECDMVTQTIPVDDRSDVSVQNSQSNKVVS